VLKEAQRRRGCLDCIQENTTKDKRDSTISDRIASLGRSCRNKGFFDLKGMARHCQVITTKSSSIMLAVNAILILTVVQQNGINVQIDKTLKPSHHQDWDAGGKGSHVSSRKKKRLFHSAIKHPHQMKILHFSSSKM
jgi:hypothetical protein